MLDHIGLTASDFVRSRTFYDGALGALGLSVVMEVSAAQTGGTPYIGYGRPPRPFFWLGGMGPASGPMHVAFAADTRAEVDAFHRAAIGAGITIRITTARSCSILTGSTSRRSATPRLEFA